MFNAEAFFREYRLTWPWSCLQTLALTSQLLQDDPENGQEIEILLCTASVVVERMPSMQTFVLWNGGKGHACAFIYRADENGFSVTWRGTWQLKPSSRVLEAWDIDASESSSSELQLKREHIDKERIRSHGDAIYHLELPCQVIEPPSLWQIRRE